MNDIINETTYQNITSKSSIDKNSHFIYDDNYQTLISISDDIQNETQVKPSIKKLVNLIIQKANVDEIREQLIQQYS